MLDANFWLEQAKTYSERAEHLDDSRLQTELLELASVCETVASRIEQHAPGG